MSYHEIGPYPHNMEIILGSVVTRLFGRAFQVILNSKSKDWYHGSLQAL